ncbi:UNVERIFIED_CONTAM: hypothetical protein GTU68_014145 [Idotea baltica]|nr:hypothetical protein [Idotea baltica]
MIKDVTEEIAQDTAEVTGLIQSGVDPHLFKPSRSDITKILRADLVLYNGLLLEGKMTDALTRANSAKRSVVAVAEKVDTEQLLDASVPGTYHDPHVWMSPSLWSNAAEQIRDALIASNPEQTLRYKKNTEAYLLKLKTLDSWAQSSLATIPKNARVLVTAHDAFNYFGKRYDLEVRGIQGISTESEAGVKDIEEIVALLVERKIPAVFIESTVSERNVAALVEGANAKGHQVKIGGTLYSDAMGTAGTPEGTYIGMIQHNVRQVTKALGGTPLDYPSLTPDN